MVTAAGDGVGVPFGGSARTGKMARVLGSSMFLREAGQWAAMGVAARCKTTATIFPLFHISNPL